MELLPLLAALGAIILFARALGANALIALFVVLFAWILGLAALQGRIWSWTSAYLVREPAAKIPFVVKSVRPTFHIRCHEVRGVAGNRDVRLSVWGDLKELTEALKAGGFTSTKQRKQA